MPRMLFARPIAALLMLAASAPADEPDRTPSFPIAAEAEAFVGKFDRMALVKDEVFVKALQDLAKGDLSPRSKADAFALMQERIGWLFVGAARVFPGKSYAETVAMMLTTYFKYQRQMPPGLDVGPLLELARTARGEHPLRASNALLLAVILDREAAKEAVRGAIDAKAIAAANVPAIDLHNLCLAAALTLDPKVVGQVVALLPQTESEESREDILAATGIFRIDELRGPIEQFVRHSFPGSFDNSVQTALGVLAKHGPPDHFREFFKSLRDLTKDEKDIDRLRKFWDLGFRNPKEAAHPERMALKIWDGFTLKVYKDGGSITHGDSFRAWISFP